MQYFPFNIYFVILRLYAEAGDNNSRSIRYFEEKMEKEKRRIWHFPWKYAESVIIVSGVVVAGWILQSLSGPFDFRLLAMPVNLLTGCLVVLTGILAVLNRRNPVWRWLSGVPLAVTLIGTLVVLGVIMGLTPQVSLGEKPYNGIITLLGFRSMTSSWSFVLIYSFTLVSLGVLIARRLTVFRWRHYPFFLNHAGLWLVLFFAGAGSADRMRYVMYVREGEMKSQAYNEKGKITQLPVTVRLNDFYMEEYSPKLAVIDKITGRLLPAGKPEYFQTGEDRTGILAGWELRVEKYNYDRFEAGDTVCGKPSSPAGLPAAFVRMHNPLTGCMVSGWVSAGSRTNPFDKLDMDDRHTLVMMRPEPRRFVSDIDVFMNDGNRTHALLEVNKPLGMGNWMLYQYDYDREAGRMSAYTGIEIIYEPWKIPVYAGLILLAAGSVCMLWGGNRRKGVEHDME